ncbi:MAG: 3-dehydroquinate synthase [Halanaerobiales bacterium]
MEKKLSIVIPAGEKRYDIVIKPELMAEMGKRINAVYGRDKVLLVTDENVFNLYGEKLKEVLSAEYNVTEYIIPPGEGSKCNKYLNRGYDLLIENEFKRDNLIIAFGGGVVGDLAGYLAATYMRGIPFVQIPTTLLAQVDSSIGGKTAINHSTGKNLIGAFFQPSLVLIDPLFLKTLAVRELKTGLAEVIKHGFIADKELVKFLQDNRDNIFDCQEEALINIIHRSCQIKLAVVEEDEKERGKRALLNFGHTIGHALEAVTGYTEYNHGEAVAVGMVGAARLSFQRGLIDSSSCRLVEELIGLYDLPLSFQYNEDENDVYNRLFYDKKVKKNRIRWILLEQIGKAFIDEDVDNEMVKEILEGLK